ncbi:MAG: hypothetical protein A3K22_04980 [Deltaproteobacteria bacterium RBG_16_42_7]|nr:MAG: hypothetical protein A3K22_04980 [Deltaproteobacteria bacterium RBG_16_42_7]
MKDYRQIKNRLSPEEKEGMSILLRSIREKRQGATQKASNSPVEATDKEREANPCTERIDTNKEATEMDAKNVEGVDPRAHPGVLAYSK